MDVLALATPGSSGPISSGSKSRVEQARLLASEYEQVFINSLLKSMFEGMGEDDEFSGGFAGETYRGMMVTEYSKSISKAGGLGLAPRIMSDILQLQTFQE
ncbi:MAG: rod-binding protein [Cohaesibacteraceae bacterium]|nr:rod-binding protein [Cohaesibacteraceae bacterium]MBL4874933.1 rod-binding protein [Cohaesibacteraceae bacterium]MBL4875561.1 rod-binding protein [Cohaesibacteraceae bacterium]